jgi:hypothetical protein
MPPTPVATLQCLPLLLLLQLVMMMAMMMMTTLHHFPLLLLHDSHDECSLLMVVIPLTSLSVYCSFCYCCCTIVLCRLLEEFASLRMNELALETKCDGDTHY